MQGRPFFFTFWVSNEVKLHPTDASRVDEVTREHIGAFVDPPSSLERLKELGEFEESDFEVYIIVMC